jgi:hypothetical protein
MWVSSHHNLNACQAQRQSCRSVCRSACSSAAAELCVRPQMLQCIAAAAAAGWVCSSDAPDVTMLLWAVLAFGVFHAASRLLLILLLVS